MSEQPAAMNLKIIVTGAFSSGKTTLIRAVSEREVCSVYVPIPSPITKIAMDYGLIKGNPETNIVLLGTPSNARFRFDWPVSKKFVLGYIIMVDSAKPETFREAKSILAIFRAYCREPYIVVANKRDIRDAWNLDELRFALNIRPEIPVVPCVATDKESVKRVLVTLLDEVLKAMAKDKS